MTHAAVTTINNTFPGILNHFIGLGVRDVLSANMRSMLLFKISFLCRGYNLFSRNGEEKNYELFFEPDELHRVQYLLETKQFLGLSELQRSEDENTGMKLRLSLAERGKLVTAQLFEYFISAYEAVSPIMIFRNKEAVALSGAVTLEE